MFPPHRFPRPAGSHGWSAGTTIEPDDRHYQRCTCGAWRILHRGEETWRSTDASCPDAPLIEPVPRGWPYRKAWGAARLFG
ncbi:hypothetical protein [Microlunatus parietis]|uniref:Uncharacterized protein n=1 Tax=Microlunatus parietis TaxID=682979 RepID=A0A7Y9I951_9ACTN|nr:hypothetical protein [Microlunatus parietis]NYE72370.1 hypothetical protein [Microlunatus parietis]